MSIHTTNHRVAASLEGKGLRMVAVILTIIIALCAMTLLTGCEFDNLKDQEYGPVDSGNPIDTTETDTTGTGIDTGTVQIGISVAPTSIAIKTGGTAQFTATVTGTTNTGVTWLIVSGPGTINGGGLYQAPANISTPAEIVTVKAISNAKASVSATAIVVVTPQTTGGGGGGDTAETGEICFERDVLPIFQSNCAMSGCHDVASHQDGYTFTSYAGILRGVRPGDPDASKIVRMITGKDEDKGDDDDRKAGDDDDIMPPPPQKPLSAEQIALIRKWIEQGAQNTSCAPPVGSGCDTTNVTFSASVRPVLQTNCVGCHSGSKPPNGVNLESYAGVKAATSGGRLAGVISHSPGFPAMPLSGNKLPDCTIRQITAWINKGTPNN